MEEVRQYGEKAHYISYAVLLGNTDVLNFLEAPVQPTRDLPRIFN